MIQSILTFAQTL